jgi:hypothetical protein
MKKNYFRTMVFLAVGTLIISCSKDESAVNRKNEVASTNESEPYELSFVEGLSPYPAGTDAPEALHMPYPPDDPYGVPRYPYTEIKNPTAEYLKETCLVDVSKLENGKTYHSIKSGKLTIGFFDGPFDNSKDRLLKLKSSSETGWNANWGMAPNVQSENPDVFYMAFGRNDLIIYLSKPCTEFGFEIAPNHKNYDHKFLTEYGDWIYDNAKGGADVKARSPSGASLIAVKATKPFTMITLRSGDSPTGDAIVAGMAITNFRYRLAK